MAKVTKIIVKMVKLYIFGRTVWFMSGYCLHRGFTKYDFNPVETDWKTAAKLGSVVGNELRNEAKQGWSYLIKGFKE